MCLICGKYYCPAGCPSYVGDSAELGRRMFTCHSCGEYVYENEDYMLVYGKPYCIDCFNAIESNADETGGEI